MLDTRGDRTQRKDHVWTKNHCRMQPETAIRIATRAVILDERGLHPLARRAAYFKWSKYYCMH